VVESREAVPREGSYSARERTIKGFLGNEKVD
jgi:hypothetical protein